MAIVPYVCPLINKAPQSGIEERTVDAPWYPNLCGMFGWLHITGAGLTPVTTHITRGLGNVP
jgi:hypothetical protein